ncbi:MAG: hypothetical protein EOP87_04450 [Verrucomicrobiaceae bacterium]|nr:MAG: hypothetical protein EOP87_04450 [Verrucomicrobiaceae bacterium]
MTAILTLLTAILREISSGGGWISVIVIPGLLFAFAYAIPFVMRVIARLNAHFFRMMNPRAIWMQVGLFWLSILAALLHSAGLLFPDENAASVGNVGAAIGYFMCFGLFIGSGNFLARETNRIRPASAQDAQ